jgi:hypothetical protein
LEFRVSDGQNLVHDQNLRLQMRRDRKRELTYIPELYRFTGVSIYRAQPENSTISSNFRAISAFRIPKIAPFRKMFSRPVNSG